MIFVIILAVSTAFGAGDQYLGSLIIPLATDVSLLAAPWLVLPFAAGCTQLRPRRAALTGLLATITALLAYDLMTYSPVEGVKMSHPHAVLSALNLFATAPATIAGLIAGPLYGWLGHRWRVDRAWSSAVLLAGAICVEPLATLTGTGLIYQPPAGFRVAELAVGLTVAGCLIASGLAYRRARAGARIPS